MTVAESPAKRRRGSIEYEVDPDGAIVSVNDFFVVFATENGWLVQAADVLGTSLFDHVAGQRVRELHRSLLSAVRSSSKPLSLPMRCDSPTERRWLSVTFTPLAAGRVAFASQLNRIESRPYQPLLDPTVEASTTGEMLSVCAWCARARYGGAWIDIDDVAERLRITDRSAVPSLSHGICGRCEAALVG